MSYSVYYSYDKSRRMTTQYTDAAAPIPEAHYYTYNQRSMVTQIQDVKSAGQDANRYFYYNGVGERVVVFDGAGPQYWTYDGSKLLTEKDTTSTVRRYRHNQSTLDSFGTALEILDGSNYFYAAFDQFANVTRLQCDLGSSESSTSKLFFNAYGQSLAAAFSPATNERLRNWSTTVASLTAASQQMSLSARGGILLTSQALFVDRGAVTRLAGWLVGCGAGIPGMGVGAGQQGKDAATLCPCTTTTCGINIFWDMEPE
jgi:hypothetical protein